MGFDHFGGILGREPPVPDAVRIDDGQRAMVAGVLAAGLQQAQPGTQFAAGLHGLAQALPDGHGAQGRAAGSRADQGVVLVVRHLGPGLGIVLPLVACGFGNIRGLQGLPDLRQQQRGHGGSAQQMVGKPHLHALVRQLRAPAHGQLVQPAQQGRLVGREQGQHDDGARRQALLQRLGQRGCGLVHEGCDDLAGRLQRLAQGIGQFDQALARGGARAAAAQHDHGVRPGRDGSFRGVHRE